MSLTAIFPRPVEITLGGGRRFRVGELTLGDLADLQAWLDRQWVDPLAGFRDRLGEMDEGERREALTGAWDAAYDGPPAWGSERASSLCGSGAGILEVFRVALRRHHPELDEAAIVAVAERTSPAEYAAMKRVMYGVTPIDEVERWLDEDGEDRGGPVPWPRAVCEVLEVYPGLGLGDVERMTLTQFRILRSGGNPKERGTVVQPKTNLREVVAAARKKFLKVEKEAG